jgi:hypothetical protein
VHLDLTKCCYRRHTNFAIESIEQVFNGSADFGKRVTCTVSRNGDLIWRVYLQVDLPAVTQNSGGFAWTNNLGNVMIRMVEVEIGGQRIDRQYGDWMNIWNELTIDQGKVNGYANMIGDTSDLTTGFATGSSLKNSLPAKTLYIPLFFWFCRVKNAEKSVL